MSVASIADLPVTRGYSGPDQPDPDLLRACVHCGMCLPSCPTYRMTGQEASSPRGRLWMMSAVSDGTLDLLDPAFDEQMYQCLNCRACEAVCPSGVHYGPLVEAARAQLEAHRPRPAWQRAAREVLIGWLFGEANRMRGVVAATRAYQRTGLQGLVRRSGLARAVGMADLEEMLPPVATRSLVPGRETWRADASAHRVMLFNTCMMGTVFADVNRAAGRVMARNGCDVDLPAGQQCCGALHVHAGMLGPARDLARRNIDAFEAAGPGGQAPIVLTAAGCGAALKEYGELLKDDPDYAERAGRFSARVRDITEWLATTGIVPPRRPYPITVTYQEPCHLAHAQRLTAEPRQVLAAIPGLRLIEMAESSLCCGSAGIYNIIRRPMANDLGDRKAANAVRTEAEVVVTANPGCAMQLRTSLGRAGSSQRIMHIVEVLDAAYGGEGAPDVPSASGTRSPSLSDPGPGSGEGRGLRAR